MTGLRYAVLLVVALPGCVVARQTASPLGGSVRATRQTSGPSIAGELIAVTADSLWVLTPQQVPVSVPLAALHSVSVRRGKVGFGTTMGYSVALGLVTGGALALSCSQVADECGGVLPGVLLITVVVGALASVSLESSATLSIPARRWEELRPYARFPQGMPDSLRHSFMATTLPQP
jgi:hypothetical protein